MEWLGDALYVWFHPKYEWLWGVVVPVTFSVISLTVIGMSLVYEWVRDRLRS